MEKNQIKTDLLEIVKKTKPFHQTHGNKNKMEIDFEYWKNIETILEKYQNQKNNCVFVELETILQTIKSNTKIPSNFGYFITEKLIENKIRVHIGYEIVKQKNQNVLMSLLGKKLNIDDVVAKLTYITDNDIKQLKRKSYQIFLK